MVGGTLAWGAFLGMLAGLTGLAFLSAHITDMLGIHAFFGAFLAGVCVPRKVLGETRLNEAVGHPLQVIIRVALPFSL